MVNRHSIAAAALVIFGQFFFPSAEAGIKAERDPDGTYKVALPEHVFRLRFLTPTSFRLRSQIGDAKGAKIPERVIVVADESRPATAITVSQTGSIVEFTTASLRLILAEAAGGTLEAKVRTDSGDVTEQWLLTPLKRVSSLRLRTQEHVYGFGDKREAIDQRGHEVEIINQDAFASEDNDSYKSVPFFFTSRGYGLLLHNFYFSTFDVGAKQSDRLSITQTDGELDFYFFLGQPKEVLAQYTELTGRPAILPRWAFGYHQGKAAYEGREAYTVANEMRKRNLPIDAIYYDDWISKAVTGDFVSGLKKQFNVRLTVGGNPFEIGNGPFMKELASRKYLMIDDKGRAVIEPAEEIDNADDVGYIDFFNPQATRFWFNKNWEAGLKNGIIFGMADFGEMDHINAPALKFWPSNGVSVDKTRNIYGLVYTEAMVREARRISGGRSTGMVRPGFAGSQRLGWTTTADSLPTFQNFRAHVRAFLNLALTGFSNIGYDIGGWDGVAADNVYARWFAAGTFNPFMWAHGKGAHEPYAHGEKVEKAARFFLELRYRLIPYFYSLHELAHRTGVPIVRPFPLQEPGDARSATIDDQFFVGDALLVAPLFNSVGQRSVYLPKGSWYDFFKPASVVDGPRDHAIQATALDRLPVFVRSGSIIPLGPVMQHASERSPDPLEVGVYSFSREELVASERQARFRLYEDDGESLAYEKGAFQQTLFQLRQSTNEATLDVKIKSGDGAYRSIRERNLIFRLFGLQRLPVSIKLDGKELPSDSWRLEADKSVRILLPISSGEQLQLEIR